MFSDLGGWFNEMLIVLVIGVMVVIDGVLLFIGFVFEDGDNYLIKWVIGLLGDYIVCCIVDGCLMVNGILIDELYFDLLVGNKKVL